VNPRAECFIGNTLRCQPPIGFAPAAPVDEPLPEVSPLLPDVALPVVPPDVPLVAAVGTACAVQVNDGVVLLVLLVLPVDAGCVHMTTRFLVVSIYQVDTGVVVLLVLVDALLPLLLGISGMYGNCPLVEVV
jgi:hypothetical protein